MKIEKKLKKFGRNAKIDISEKVLKKISSKDTKPKTFFKIAKVSSFLSLALVFLFWALDIKENEYFFSIQTLFSNPELFELKILAQTLLEILLSSATYVLLSSSPIFSIIFLSQKNAVRSK